MYRGLSGWGGVHRNFEESNKMELSLSFFSFFLAFWQCSLNPQKYVLAALVAEWVRSLNFSALNHSIISPLCLVYVRAPHWPHVRHAKFCLRMCQVFLPGYSRFAPPTDWLVSI